MAHDDRKGYFHTVARLTPTRFWINNPTLREARQAIEAGAVACTTNPTYAAKMARSTEDAECFKMALEAARARKLPGDPSEIAREVQRGIAKLEKAKVAETPVVDPKSWDDARSLLELSDTEADALPRLPRGRALWHVGSLRAAVDHHLAASELAIVDTDQRMHS